VTDAERSAVTAERALLGALMVDPWAVAEVAAVVEPADFSTDRGAALFATMLRIADRGEVPDWVTLEAELEATGLMAAVGGADRLLGLINRCPSSTLAMQYARAVAEGGGRRRLALAPPDLPGLTGIEV
jgi:replicative DNA helicase